MPFDTFPQGVVLEKLDRLPPNQPYVAFMEMFHKEALLYPNGGYNPLRLRLRLMKKNLDEGVLAVEYSPPPADFQIGGASISAYEVEGFGGRTFRSDPTAGHTSQLRGGLPWASSGFTVLGDAGVVSGNVITLSNLGSDIALGIISSSGIVENPIFRVRRKFDTVIAAEVLGVGTGAQTSFSFTTAQKPICPCSVMISFTDGGGAKVDLIRDDGRGRLVSLPPAMLLSESLPSTINYATGEIVLEFSSSHIPTAANITADYEYMLAGVPDIAEYDVKWSIGT